MSLPLADESVDLIVTSPPYFALRSYTDGGEHYDGQIGSEATPHAFLAALWAVTAECVRVLKPSGSLWVNLGDKYSGSGQRDYSNMPHSGAKDKKLHRVAGVPDAGGIPAKSLMLLPQRYAIGCIDQLGLICRAEVIWSKPNGLPESVTDRVRRSHEDWFHFTKEPRYFSAVDEVREPHDGRAPMPNAARGPSGMNRGLGTEKGSLGAVDLARNPLGKLPGSVWTVPTEPLRVPDHLGVDHFAAFPSEWPRRIILGWSPSGVCVACGEGRRPVVEKADWWQKYRDEHSLGDFTDRNGAAGVGAYRSEHKVPIPEGPKHQITGYACACPDTTAPTRPAVVLDPFCGTGTTPAVAHALGRHGIGVDLSADYLRLAEWRCNDPALRAKVLRVDKPKAVPDGQQDLFGGAA